MESGFFNSWKNTGLPPSGSVISNPTASNGNLGFKGGATTPSSTVGQDPYVIDALNMSPNDRLALSKLLKSAGYLRTASSKYNKSLGDAYREAANDFQSESVRTGRPTLTLTQFLSENVQAPTGTGKSNLPSRNVYQYTEADRIKMLDDVSQTLRGQAITEEDKSAKWYKDLKKSVDNMIATGTVSTSQKVKNPKTGQLEVKTVSTPGFSQEQVAATAEKAIRKATPEDVARKERVDFTSWMFSTLGGRNG
jgi:hypothetical protein